LKDKGRRDYTLNPTIRGPTNGVQLIPLPEPLTRSPFAYSTSTLNFDGALNLGLQKNIWQNTENLNSSSYSAQSGSVGTSTVVWNGITLTEFTTSNFYGSIYSNLSGIGYASLVPGQRYLFSYYAENADAGDHFVWTRSIASGGSYGHGPHLIDNSVRRIWFEVQAVSSSTVDAVSNPTVPIGSGTASAPFWLFNADSDTYAVDGSNAPLNLYIGGFQIEPVNDTSPIGVALIGDSTMAGSSGEIDSVSSREVSTYAAALMNVPWFNRAVGGNTCANMLARWPADMAPLAVNSKYAVIECGINDIGQGVASSTIESEITSMYDLAQSEGMIPVMMTITPGATIGASATLEAERESVNTWIEQTFPRVLDIASIIQDPNATSSLSKNPAYIGDGVHYTQAANRLIANYIARSTVGNAGGYPEIFEFPAPSPYQPILGTNFVGSGALNVNGAATSTFASGINIASGCFSVAGTCVSAGGGSGTIASGLLGQFPFCEFRRDAHRHFHTLFVDGRQHRRQYQRSRN
jgi:lysophospholipase L1-like esterase